MMEADDAYGKTTVRLTHESVVFKTQPQAPKIFKSNEGAFNHVVVHT